MNKLTIFSDGGSRGNPGHAACAFVVISESKVVAKGSRYLGIATNNMAEYQGVILALEWLNKNLEGINLVDFYLDSQLVYKQLIGEYKIKNESIRSFVLTIKRLEDTMDIVINYYHVPRIKNKLADKLVNIELDKN